MTKVAAVAVLAVSAAAAQAATLNAGDVLTIASGSFDTAASSSGENIAYNSGSFFGVDLNSNNKISLSEATAISMGTTGITIGQSSTALGEIDAAQLFNGSPIMHRVTSAITGNTTSGLTMGGWVFNWNGNVIAMGGGAWQSSAINPTTDNVMQYLGTYTSGKAVFSWDGIYGHGYTLDYTATVQSGGFTGIEYYWHLEGSVVAVPEASTYGMMLAGLGLVGFAVRRRKRVA
jgi:hypothetical protein